MEKCRHHTYQFPWELYAIASIRSPLLSFLFFQRMNQLQRRKTIHMKKEEELDSLAMQEQRSNFSGEKLTQLN
jgi:hypothetical protein